MFAISILCICLSSEGARTKGMTLPSYSHLKPKFSSQSVRIQIVMLIEWGSYLAVSLPHGLPQALPGPSCKLMLL